MAGKPKTVNAAEFQLANGLLMLGIFHVRCSCQPTSALSAPINLTKMTAVCRFCGMVYTVEEFSLTAKIHADIDGVPVSPAGSSQLN